MVTRSTEEERVEHEKESPNHFSCNRPNLNKMLERRQAESKQLQMPVMVHSEVGKGTSSGGPTGWTITEITKESGIKMANQQGSAEKQ